MVRKKEGASSRLVYYILIGIVFALGLTLAGGTLYALFRGPEAAAGRNNDSLSGGGFLPRGGGGSEVSDENIFAGIGKIRVSTAGPDAATVILSVAFPYIPGDNAFSEELAARVNDFRRITAEFFMSFSTEELRRQNETDIKTELLRRYNRILRLGRIERLFFNDYMIIE